MSDKVWMEKAKEITNKYFPLEHRPDAESDIASVLKSTAQEAREEQKQIDAGIARSTKFMRICEPHEPIEVEIKTIYRGCSEIEQAILSQPTEVKL